MKLTQAQRNFIVEKIEYWINDAQTSDHYDFGDLQISWVQSQEAYLIEEHGEMNWAQPKEIISYIDDLSDQALVDFWLDETGYEQEHFEEVLEDEMMAEETV